MLYQRRPTSGISSMNTKIARAAQRKSRSVIADETWRQSTCRETYQKHAPVTSSLAAMIAAFSTLRRCDGRGVSNSLAMLALIRLRPWPARPPQRSVQQQVSLRDGNGRDKRQVQALNRQAS